MAYNQFGEWPYKVYDKTFLKDVRLCITFTKKDGIDGQKDALAEFFKSFFNIKTDPDKFTGLLHVKSMDECIDIDFRQDSVEIVMRRPAYKSFRLTETMMKSATEYLHILGVTAISHLEFTKYNELEYTLGEKPAGVVEVMKGVFSSELIDAIKDESLKDNEAYLKTLTRWEKVLTMTDGETKSIFNIEYGFSRKNIDSPKGILALKTRIETDMDGMVFTELGDRVALFNKILDSAFHWCVRKEVIAMMEG